MKKLSTQLTGVVAGTALFAMMGLAQAQSSTNPSGTSGSSGSMPAAGEGSGSMPAAGSTPGSGTGSSSSDNANFTSPGSAINQNQETMRSGSTTLTEAENARALRDQSATGTMDADRPTRTARADRN